LISVRNGLIADALDRFNSDRIVARHRQQTKPRATLEAGATDEEKDEGETAPPQAFITPIHPH
jgi:hypothetical protein